MSAKDDLTGTAHPTAENDSHELYRAVLETTVDGIISISTKGIIETFNPAAERMFGWKAHEAIGRNVSMLMPEPDRSGHDGYLSNYLKTGHAKIIGIGREVTGLRKDGSTFPMELAVGEAYPGGRPVFAGITRDISARKQVEAESRQRLHQVAHFGRVIELGELASSLAHEINQPLTAIVALAQACLRLQESGNADEATIQESLDQIATQAGRASEVIRRLRRLIEKRDAECLPCDLNAVVDDALQLFRRELEAGGIAIQTDFAHSLPPVEIDSVQIEQVVLNLIRNAADAMSQDMTTPAVLRLTTRYQPKQAQAVQLEVSDNGMGFGPEVATRLFEPFFSTKSNGLGQGLAICRSIMEVHGGRLDAESDPGKGACFRLSLPVAPGDAG